MAGSILTLYCDNPEQSGSSAGLLNLTQPTASTSTTGWTVGTTVAARFSRQTFRTEKAAATFGATVEPSGAPLGKAQDCWRISAITTGQFSAGTWYSSVSVIAVTSGSDQDGNALFRLWQSANADGSGAVELTKSRMTGTTVTNLTTTVAQSSSASTQIAASNLTNEYLFLQVGWQITGAGGNVNRDVLVRLGSLAQTTGSGLITSAFSSITPVSSAKGGGYYHHRKSTDAMTSFDEC
jgi:hypothetical protein